MSGSVLEKVKEIDRKIDELFDFLEDVFLTYEEYLLVKDTDKIVKEKKFDKLVPLDDV
ncbi:MAG: hypothetical protein ACTSXW_00260 [Candidatus Baldrarchaeia archaeon]